MIGTGTIGVAGSHVSQPLGGGLTVPEARQWLADEATGFGSRECRAFVHAGRCPEWPCRRWAQPRAAWVESSGNGYPSARRGGYWQTLPSGPVLPPWLAADVTPWPTPPATR